LVAGWLTAGCEPGAVSPPAPTGDIRRDATVMAIEAVLPSVVNIATTKIVEVADFYDPIFERWYGHQKEALNSIGSGVIIDEEGYLLTNLHVLGRASRIQVKLWNGDVYDAEPSFVGTPLKDIALLRIKAPEGKKFQAMQFAHDDDLLLGESVIALGNPYGLGGSVTRGILSSKNRRPSAGDAKLDIPDWLQTDADINPGNSGGPLINLRGEMIGINARVYREGEGMGVGFAIPVKQISEALSEFFTPEAANGLWFGARVGSFSPPLSIIGVQPRSPAEKAGVRVGQRVVTVNGQSPRNQVDFHRFATARADHTVKLEVEANGLRRTLTVPMVTFRDLTQQRLGVVLRSVTPQDVASLQLDRNDGVLVDQIERGGPADQARLQPSFLLTALDELKAGTLLHAADIVSTKQPGDRVKIFFTIPRSFGAGAGEYNTTLTVR
jgi:serine protease Do